MSEVAVNGYSFIVMSYYDADKPIHPGALHRGGLVHADILADPFGVRFLRSAMRTWLQRHFNLDEERLADLTLAVNEALANVAEHAYVGRTEAATMETMDLCVDYDRTEERLTVTVTDRGRWHAPAADPLSLHGRGIPLIHALAHHATIDSADSGTRVSMVWNGLRQTRRAVET